MQIDHYENIFRPILFGEGYESIYLKRTGDKPDGCCLFYKINRLKLIQSKSVSFYQQNIQMLDR
jgi:mRNA deadenylase 3'-5' endonuclease subunit Ccr4